MSARTAKTSWISRPDKRSESATTSSTFVVSRAVSKRSRPFSRAGGHVAVLALDNRARRTYSELLRRTLQEIRLFGGCEVQIRNPRIPNPENHFLLSKL